MEKKKYKLIVDLEATCCDDKSIKRCDTEIIEIGAVRTNLNYEIIDKMSVFVKPTKHGITPFCTELTSITQEMVDDGVTLEEGLKMVKDRLWTPDTLFCSWGYYDRNQIKMECEQKNIEYPFDDLHENIKLVVKEKLGLKQKKSLPEILEILGLEFEGNYHRGIDDALNMVKIMKKLLNK